jgi:hypothetical protein
VSFHSGDTAGLIDYHSWRAQMVRDEPLRSDAAVRQSDDPDIVNESGVITTERVQCCKFDCVRAR